MHLINWKARRAGGRITINGTDETTGQPAKIVGVDVIEPGKVNAGGDGYVVATDKDGGTHRLII